MIGPIMLAGLLSSHRDGPAIRSYREAPNPARADPGSNSQADASIPAAPDASPLAMAASTPCEPQISIHLDHARLCRFRRSSGHVFLYEALRSAAALCIVGGRQP